MRRQYKKPPILEATFECHFEPSESWSLASPASLFDNLKSDYPAEPTIVAAGNLEVKTEEGIFSPSFRMLPQAQRYQFGSLDGRHLVRIGREVLSVHEMAPYPEISILFERNQTSPPSSFQAQYARLIRCAKSSEKRSNP